MGTTKTHDYIVRQKQPTAKASRAAQPKREETHPKVNVDRLAESDILHLQRTIGNRAVQNLLEQRNQRGSAQPAIMRKLMTYDEFRKATGQTVATSHMPIFKSREATVGKSNTAWLQDVFEGKVGLRDLREKREKLGSSYEKSLDPDNARAAQEHVNINAAYLKYEKDPTIANLTALNDAITFFRTMFAGMDWLKPIDMQLRTLLIQIRAELDEKMEAQGLLTKGAEAATTSTQDPQAWLNQSIMPLFLKDVGISQSYFEQHINGHQDVQDALSLCYTSYVKGGDDIYAANHRFRSEPLANVPGIKFVQSMFAARFPTQVEMAQLVGTQRQEGQPLTPDEERGLRTYTGGKYQEMNNAMMDKAKRTRSTKLDAGLLSVNELAVSAMNKLPRYVGRAYRVLIPPPPGLLEALHPGTTTAYLGFTSASPSMRGVKNFRPGVALRPIHFIVHAKSAVNVVGYSVSPAEGEIIFKPGTQFLVKHIWEYQNGKIPANAPADAKMILYEYGKDQDQDTGEMGYHKEVIPGKTDDDPFTFNWHKAKVIEVVEV
ncbi:MAG: hypothetical protein SF029_19615 [bacterium]|nr:hypothetical protein [bacterium]